MPLNLDLNTGARGMFLVDSNGNQIKTSADGSFSTQDNDNTPIATTPGAANNAILFATDTQGYRGITFSLYGTYTLGTQTEASNDGTNWVACQVLDTNSNSYTTSPTSQNRAYYAPATARYFRVRVSSYTSGTITSVALLKQTNVDPGNVTISGVPSIQGNVQSAANDSGAPVKVGGRYNAAGITLADNQRGDLQLDNKARLVTRPTTIKFFASDAWGNESMAATDSPDGGAISVCGGYLYNGGTWDRIRDVTSANNTTGTGIQAVGPLAAYNATTPTFTDGRMGELQINAQGRLLVQQSSTATLTSDGQTSGFTGTGVQAVASQNQVFNGSTWDRQRGNTVGTFIAANQNFVESTTALAAASSITAAARGVGTETRFAFFVAEAYADQAGTLYVERSTNGTTWVPANGTSGTAVAAGASVQVKLTITTAQYRVRFLNGATAQTSFLLTSAISLN
jgi:hypothetical protein